MMTFDEFKKFIADMADEGFSAESLYAEYTENGYFAYTTADGLLKEAY